MYRSIEVEIDALQLCGIPQQAEDHPRQAAAVSENFTSASGGGVGQNFTSPRRSKRPKPSGPSAANWPPIGWSRELRKLAGANMADYMKSTPEGLSVVDFSGLTRDQTAALSQVTVEDVAGGKRVQFKLHDKRAAAPARIAYPGARCGWRR
jgi:hypothetical protein